MVISIRYVYKQVEYSVLRVPSGVLTGVVMEFYGRDGIRVSRGRGVRGCRCKAVRLYAWPYGTLSNVVCMPLPRWEAQAVHLFIVLYVVTDRVLYENRCPCINNKAA